MIQVLRSWLDVGKATLSLQRMRLPTHITVQKNWDQFVLAQLLLTTPKHSAILDLGCGSCSTLKFLAALGFSDLSGIDLRLPPLASRLPFKLRQGDLTHTPFADQSFDRALSISTIEHGVDLEAFFREAHRILKPDGTLFVTTDYWEEKIEVDASIRPFGLPWRVFSRTEIDEAIAIARACGFQLDQDTGVPPCQDRTVTWQGKDYTFIALSLRKAAAPSSTSGVPADRAQTAGVKRPTPGSAASGMLRVLYLENSAGDSFRYYSDILEALKKEPGVRVDVFRRWIANPRLTFDLQRLIVKQQLQYEAIVFGFGWTNCGSGPPAKAICPPGVRKFILLNKEYDGLEEKLRWIRENQIDCAFTVHHDFKRYEELTGVPFVHLPFAADPDLFKDHHQDQEYDFGFTGIVRPEQTLNWRSRIHQSLGDRALWGDTRVFFSEHLHDTPLEYAQRLNRARIWLSTTGPADLVGTRYYEVMLTGTTLLACNRFDYRGLFEEDEHCIAFETLEELAEKVRYHSDPRNAAERRRIVSAARELASKRHSWTQRSDQLLSTIRRFL